MGEASNSNLKDETGPPNNRITISSTACTGADEDGEGPLQESDSNNTTMTRDMLQRWGQVGLEGNSRQMRLTPPLYASIFGP